MEDHQGWIGVDLDGTLAEYSRWGGTEHIGAPVPRMVHRVKAWLAGGRDVRIFTARVGPQADPASVARAQVAIRAWCEEHIGRTFPITATKDFSMAELWDDSCVQVWSNTGQRADGLDDPGTGCHEEPHQLLAKLLAGPLPLSLREYRRALAMAEVLGRRMEGQEQSLHEMCEPMHKGWFRFPGWPDLLKKNPRSKTDGSRVRLRAQ